MQEESVFEETLIRLLYETIILEEKAKVSNYF